MQINNTNNAPNFKARVEIVNPQKLFSRINYFREATSRVSTTQAMIDTITLAKNTAPLVGTEKDVIKLDFGKIVAGIDDPIIVSYNNEEKSILFVSENPLIGIADVFERLTDEVITRKDLLEQPEYAWGSFSIGENGQIQRILRGEKARVVDTETTTMEKLTEKLKKLLGLN